MVFNLNFKVELEKWLLSFFDATKVEPRDCEQIGITSEQSKYVLHLPGDQTKSIFVKSMDLKLTGPCMLDAVNKEVAFYTELLPNIHGFLDRECSNQGVKALITSTFPEFYAYKQVYGIHCFVMEDFSTLKMAAGECNYTVPVDMRLGALRKLATFHAIMFAMKQRGQFEDATGALRAVRFMDPKNKHVALWFDGFLQMVHKSLEMIAKSLVAGNKVATGNLSGLGDPGEILEGIRSVEEAFPAPYTSFCELETAEGKQTLILGDCHTHNLALNPATGAATFFDLQLVRESNSLVDYVELLATLLSAAERREHQGEADRLYYSAFAKTLATLGITENPYGSVQGLTEERKRLVPVHVVYHGFFGFKRLLGTKVHGDLHQKALMEALAHGKELTAAGEVEGVVEWLASLDKWAALRDLLEGLLDYKNF